ncbi:hypothetical protein HDV57DRAFT_446092 [Trichoderma longibrachiatum]|uniref:Uncharacterized protein n=1 Tax=Trichoderma longibrachiatum ATCC 18648 TaxID=983965 RepID=A0A2T4CG86_TRILO|nr:hypothetical protein M440DRAFT_197780 [Trichoderma longibrachiatum ATCC 18648]
MLEILHGTPVKHCWDWLAAEPDLPDLQIVTQFTDRTSASHRVRHPTAFPPLQSAICRPNATRHSVTPACRMADKEQAAALTQGGRLRCEMDGLHANNAAVARLWSLWRRCGGRDAVRSSYERGEQRRSNHVELAFGWLMGSRVSLLGRRFLVCPRRNRIELDRPSPRFNSTHHHYGRAPSPSIHQGVLAIDDTLVLLPELPPPPSLPAPSLMLAKWRHTITCTGSTGSGSGQTGKTADGTLTGATPSERRQTSRPKLL